MVPFELIYEIYGGISSEFFGHQDAPLDAILFIHAAYRKRLLQELFKIKLSFSCIKFVGHAFRVSFVWTEP